MYREGSHVLLTLLQFFATKFLFLALHLESGCFPRPLTARKEAAAFRALHAGDAAAREKLIRHNLRLVAHIVKKYYAQHPPLHPTMLGQNRKAYVERGALFIGWAASRVSGVPWAYRYPWWYQ